MNPVIYQLRIQRILSDKLSPSKHLGQRSDSVRKCNKRINKRTSILLKYVRSGCGPSWPQLRIRKCYQKLNSSLLEHPQNTTPAQPSSANATSATQSSTRKFLPLSHIWRIILYEIITGKVHKPSTKATHHEASKETPQHVTRKPKQDHTPSKNDKTHDGSKKPSQPEHDTRKSGRPTQPQRSHTLANIKIDIWMVASVTPKVKKYLILINFLSSARFLTYI